MRFNSHAYDQVWRMVIQYGVRNTIWRMAIQYGVRNLASAIRWRNILQHLSSANGCDVTLMLSRLSTQWCRRLSHVQANFTSLYIYGFILTGGLTLEGTLLPNLDQPTPDNYCTARGDIETIRNKRGAQVTSHTSRHRRHIVLCHQQIWPYDLNGQFDWHSIF